MLCLLPNVGSFMDRSTNQQYLAEDMQRLDEMLSRVTKSDEALSRYLASGGGMQLLNLACGACNEAGTLANFFGRFSKETANNRKLKFVGLDIRAREIADAAARFRGNPNAEFEFLRGDATKLHDHQQLPSEFDVVFVRHQNLWNGKSDWEKIYHKALEKLSPNGRLIITSYFDREHQQALEVIKEQGGELVVTEANEMSRELPTPGKFVDRHVAILKRQSSL